TVELRLRARVRLAISGRRTGNRRRGVRGTPPTHPVTAAPTTIASADRPGGITVLRTGGTVPHRPCGTIDTVSGNPPLRRGCRLLLRAARRVAVVPGSVRVTHAATQCRTPPPDDCGERADTARVPRESAGPVTRPDAADTRSAAAGPVPRPGGDPRSAAPHPAGPDPARPVRATRTRPSRTGPTRSRGRQPRVGFTDTLSVTGG